MKYILLLGVFPLLLFLGLSFGEGTGIPPDESKTLGKTLPNVKLVDSNGEVFELYSLKGKPIILSPIYTHCNSACPIITDSLKKVIYKLGKPGKDFWVLSLSFDPQDSVEDLKRFSESHKIEDEGWKVVITQNREDLFKLLDAIDFRFMTLPESRDFVHPNLVVFISPDMKIRKYVYGVVFSEKDVKKALDYAMGKEDIAERLRPYLFFIGLVGFGVSSLYVLLQITQKGSIIKKR